MEDFRHPFVTVYWIYWQIYCQHTRPNITTDQAFYVSTQWEIHLGFCMISNASHQIDAFIFYHCRCAVLNILTILMQSYWHKCVVMWSARRRHRHNNHRLSLWRFLFSVIFSLIIECNRKKTKQHFYSVRIYIEATKYSVGIVFSSPSTFDRKTL